MAKSLDIIDPKKELGDDEPKEEGEMVHAEGSQEKSSGGVFYLVIGIIAVIVSTSLALYILFKDDGGAGSNSAQKSQTATVSPSSSETATESATATTEPQETTTPATSSFKYTDESIRIVNGNGVSGEAAKVKDLLEGKGYSIASVANASRTYGESIVYHKTGQEDLAKALKNDISSLYSAKTELSDSTVGSYDAIIALGAK